MISLLKRTQQYFPRTSFCFPVVLFIMLYKVSFASVDKILKCDRHSKTKATEQYFPVVLSIMLYKVVLTFESVDAILKCDHSNESY